MIYFHYRVDARALNFGHKSKACKQADQTYAQYPEGKNHENKW